MGLELVVLSVVLSSIFALADSVASVDSTAGLPLTRECNVTLTEPSIVAVPEVTHVSHHVGGPLRCEIKIRMRESGVVKIEFRRLKLGGLVDGRCSGNAFLKIVDGSAGVTEDFGRYCGEAEQIRTYYAESANVDVIAATESFADDSLVDYEFLVTAVPKAALRQRFGPRPELFPHARGNRVEGTFCERLFSGCSRNNPCYVQSPGYPGVYPRNLRCRYYVSTKQSFIKLYPDNRRTPMSFFDVAGQRCDSIVECPFRGVGQEGECETDKLKIYDGVDEFSPLIGTFCGIGHLPSSVVGTSSELFLEFESAHDGPFLGNGFDLRVGHLPGNADPYYSVEDNGGNRACHRVFDGESIGGQEGLFLSLEHWYPPGTNCTFVIQGRENEIARLTFPSFKIRRIENPINTSRSLGDCKESLTIFDSSWTEGRKVIKTFCDGFSRPMEKYDFVSTGSALVVNFLSRTGSYSGSSLQYWAQYDFFDASTDGERVEGTECDERIRAAKRGGQKSFRSPRNSLVFKKNEAEGDEAIECRYDMLAADQAEFSRLQLNVNRLHMKEGNCGGEEREECVFAGRDHIQILDPLKPGNGSVAVACISSCDDGREELTFPAEFFSRGPYLTLVLSVAAKSSLVNYFKSDEPIFEASFEPVHPWRTCGPPIIPREAGVLAFRNSARSPSEWPLHCVWDISDLDQGRRRRRFSSMVFSIGNVTLPPPRLQAVSCQVASLEIRLSSVRGGSHRHFRQCAGAEDGDHRGGATSVVEELKAKDLEGVSSIRVHLTLGRGVDSGDYIGFHLKWSFQ